MLKRTLSTMLAFAVFASQTVVLASENPVSNLKITGTAEVGKSIGVSYDLAEGADEAAVNWLVSAPGDDEYFTTDVTGESFVVDYSQMGMGIKAKVTSGEYSEESEAVTESISGLVHVKDDFSSDIVIDSKDGYSLSDSSSIVRDTDDNTLKFIPGAAKLKATRVFPGVSGKTAFSMKIKHEANVTSSTVIEGAGGAATIITYDNQRIRISVLNDAGTGATNFTAGTDYAIGKWHLLNGVFDTDSDSFSFYIDGKKIFDEKKFRGAGANLTTIAKIYTELSANAAGGIKIDNISFRSVYPLPECEVPVADNAIINGMNKLGSTLGVSYDYENAFVEQGSIVNWYISDTKDGDYTKLDLNAKTIGVSDLLLGKYVKAGIVPSNIWGTKGKEIFAEALAPKNTFIAGLSDSFDSIPEKNFTIKKGEAGKSIIADGSLNITSDATVNPEMTYLVTTGLKGKAYADLRIKSTGGAGLIYIQGSKGAGVRVNIDSASNLKVNDTVVATAIADGSWYDIRLAINLAGNTTDAAIDVYVNGEKKATGLLLKAEIDNITSAFIAKTSAGTLSIDKIDVFTVDTNGGVLDNGVVWKYDTTSKTLTISGNGAIPDYVTVGEKTAPNWYENREWNSIAAEIEKLVVEEGITAIGSNCFRGAAKLTSVTLPSTCKSINAYAFTRSGITQIDLPEGLETIADGAFANVLTLKEITFPKSVKSINKYAFNNSTGNVCILENVNVYKNTAGQDFAKLWNINCTVLDAITVKYDASAKAATISAPEVTVATVIFAVHSASGLEEVKVLEDEFLLEGENIIDDQGITVGEGDTVSVLVWDSISTLVPLA